MKTDAPLVVVIDGQGGMIGRKLCDQLLETKPEMNLLALGTNSAATSAMLKGKVLSLIHISAAVTTMCMRFSNVWRKSS